MQNHTGLYILLASGFSRRFGSPKLLHPLSSGKTIIGTSVEALQTSGCHFVVVIREDDAPLSTHIDTLGAEVITVTNARKGLSSVIAEATSTLSLRRINWLGICLGDMPYINPTTFAGLTHHISPTTIVRPRYKGIHGHPVLFGREYFNALKKLRGDNGAKSIIKTSSSALRPIDVDDPMILHDIDRPDDLATDAAPPTPAP